MKKCFVSAILLICVLLSLSACGTAPQAVPDAAPTPAAEPAPSPSAPSETPAPGESAPQTPAEPEPTPVAPAFDEEKFNAALALKGEDISLLFEAIGEPLESSYAPSCIGASGEDGELIYEGFYVATYRNGEKEIVWDVISDVG